MSDVIAPPPRGRVKRVWVPGAGRWARFIHRDLMRKGRQLDRRRHARARAVPATALPVDSTGGQTVSCPMDGNDQLGDCGEAMLCHADNILTYGQGKPGFTESTFALAALEGQYERLSGGDHGMDEDMVVGPQGAWTVGIAGDAAAVADDHLDFDITDAALTQYLIDQFYTVQMAWSVPDAFVQQFKSGAVFPHAMTPDPDNGHFTTQSDVGGPAGAVGGVNVNGFYCIWTWGGYAWVSPAFVASVQPEAFVAFSRRQFNAQGYDSKGRHVTTQAAAWVAVGGDAAKAASVVAMFPAPGPTPGPGPVIPPVTPPAPVATPPSYDVTLSFSLPGLFGHTAVTATGKATPEASAKGAFPFGPLPPFSGAKPGLTFPTFTQLLTDLIALWAAFQSGSIAAVESTLAVLAADFGIDLMSCVNRRGRAASVTWPGFLVVAMDIGAVWAAWQGGSLVAVEAAVLKLAADFGLVTPTPAPAA